MKDLVNKNILKMQAYNPPLEGRAGLGYLLLDFNERTIPYDKNINKYLKKYLNKNLLNIYPAYNNVIQSIANYAGTKKGNILITNGTDQAIEVIFKSFTRSGDQVIIPSPSFAWFFQCAKINSNNIISPLYQKENLAFPLETVLKKISKKIKLIVICNPNNPTGTSISLSDIEKILKKAKNSLVYIDEAYFGFSQITAISLLKKYENLIISRTFSKAFGLAGLRIGYIIANRKIIKEMQKVRGPYEVNSLGATAVEYVLKNLNGYKNYIDEIMNEAKPLLEKYLKQKNIKYYPSNANFILIKPNNPKKVFNHLKINNILTRPRTGNIIDGTIRITLGTVKQTKKLIRLLDKLTIC
jgi:histidinol-phosphate aminotransferase